MSLRLQLSIAPLLTLLAAPLLAQRPLNLDFEMPAVAYPLRPWGWSLGWSAFSGGRSATFTRDSAMRASGKWSLRVSVLDSAPVTDPAVIMLQVPAAFARGKVLTLRGTVRTAGLEGRAEFTLEAWGDRRIPAGDTGRYTARDADFREASLRIAVPDDPEIHSIVIQAGVAGHGTAWFDGLELAVNGRRIDAIPGIATPPTRADLAWLGTRAVPLGTVDPARDAPAPDLAQVDRIIGDARVVGLGESTHGTREFFEAKARIIRHLVRDRGFRVVAMEANQLALERVNRYVMGSDDSVRAAMHTMFQVWNTETMQRLLEWLREFNATHPGDEVRFVGYDMQDNRLPYDSLRAIVARIDPGLGPRIEALAGDYRKQESYVTPQAADSLRARWGTQADTLWRMIAARREYWLAQARDDASRREVAWAVQSANLLRQAAGFNVALFSPDRDSLMAANLDWALETLAPGKRAIVWAHDVHVSKGGDPARSFNAGAQMGAYLRRRHGEDYRSFSLLTADGAYTATRDLADYAMIEATAFPAPAGSFEAALRDLRRPAETVGWVVDLREARDAPGAAWLRIPRPIRHIGYATYDYGFDLTAVLPLEFDGVVFVEHTTPSRLVR